MAAKLPWDDLKVAFGVDAKNADDIWDRVEKARLPAGWSLDETDGTGTRWVAVFRVEGLPTVEDGKKVKAILAKM